ncbi:hypothetical protein Ate02nite_81820 [Paractinoplanes tereljensis]|uniref:NACHT domain-containing protein n=2 Tax=Paractinoplanes tereljensis TaxID=571912 RepID=A0A919NY33_9ACTN|nr:hypothetical protein Ate02nite_81820 [Actinoplanes tereljensis]
MTTVVTALMAAAVATTVADVFGLDITAGNLWTPVALAGATALIAFALTPGERGRQQPTPWDLDEATDRLADAERRRIGTDRLGRYQEASLVTALWRDPSGPRPLELHDDPAAQMADIFRHLSSRRLCIVGAPGSGKSTLVLALVEGLLRNRRPEDPVPVLLPLAGWDPRSEPPEAWVSRQLAEMFPMLATSGEQAASMLVSDGRVLPVLDGLDELPADLRSAALARLAGSRLARRPYVLTSRTDAFDQAVESTAYPLDIPIIELLPVTAQVAVDYLHRHQSADDRRWDPVLAELNADPDGLLAQALSAPWAAYAIRKAYSSRSTDPAELVDYDRFPSVAALAGHLLDVWLDSPVRGPDVDPHGRRRARFEPATTRRSLAWLADHLRDTGQLQVAWWDLGQALPRPFRVGTYWPFLAALLLLPFDQRVAAAVGFTAAVLVLLDQSRGPEPRQLARPAIRRTAVRSAAGLGFAAALATPITLLYRPSPVSTSSLAVAMVPVLVAVLLYAVVDGAAAPVAEPGGTFAEQLRRDRHALWIRSAAAAVVAGAWAWAMVMETVGYRVPAAAVAAAVTAGLVVVTGNASGRFAVTRVWLALRGRLPWRLITFIGHANHIGVLRSEAGHIEFRYASLQGMFASTPAAGRGPAIEPDLARAVVEEVCVLPEVAVRLAADDSARGEIEERARVILAERPDEVLGRGQEDLVRYRLAHDRLVQAVGRPGWTRLAPAYRIVAGLSLSLVVLGAGLRFLPRLGFVVVAGVALVVAGVLLTRAWRHHRRRSGWAKRGPRWWDVAWPVLAAIVAGAAFVVPEKHAHGPEVLAALFVVAVCWPLAMVAALLSRPHERVLRRLAADDPAYWPDAPGTGQLRTAAEQARQDWITALARLGVMPLLRDQLAANTGLFSTVLPRFDPSRLGGVSRVDQLVETAATRQLSRYLRDLSSISVGISGSRGAGKSTVLQRFCTAQFTRTAEDLLLLVPAPTAYDRREFLIHLFAEICEQVVGDDESGREPRRMLGAAVRALPGVLVVGGLVTALLAWAWPRVVSAAQLFTMGQRTAVIAGGLAATALGLVLALLTSRSGDRSAQRSATTQQMAAAQLRRLRYQLSTTAIRGGKIGLPAGAEFNASANTQRTELQRSYPELVADFRELLQQVALERRSVGRRVIIGIDELDKIASAADAERFLNDLKVIFGIPGCYFLVAVSDDALVAFDRRALAVRTTFDSAFDQIISVPPLALDEARELLSLRGVLLPEPYLWLCHALSGGLPRDLLRSVLQLATVSTDPNDELPDLARKLIESDVRSVLRAQLHQAEVATDPARPAVTAWLALGADGQTSGAVLERMVESAPVLDSKSTLTQLVSQSCGYARYAATLVQTFADEATAAVDWLREGQHSTNIDLLASARAQLSISTDSALTRVERFREEAPFLTASTPGDGQLRVNGATAPPHLN